MVFSRGGQEIVTFTEDVSQQGLRIRTDVELPPRQLLKLRICVSEAAELTCQAMVVHASPSTTDGAPTIGLRFYGLDGEPRQTWHAALAELASHAPALVRATSPAPVAVQATQPPLPEPQAAPAAEPRRQWPRRPARITVYIGSMDDLITFTSTNISRGGMFPATTESFAVGDRLRLEMKSQDTNPFFVDAVVRRHEPGGEPPGIAVEFLSEDDGTKIGEMLDEVLMEDEEDEPPVFVTSFDPNLA